MLKETLVCIKVLRSDTDERGEREVTAEKAASIVVSDTRSRSRVWCSQSLRREKEQWFVDVLLVQHRLVLSLSLDEETEERERDVGLYGTSFYLKNLTSPGAAKATRMDNGYP